MHNPRLKRWLHRIDLPTLLLWGEQDGIVTPVLRRGLARAKFPARGIEVISRRRPLPALGTARSFVDRLSAFRRQHN